MLGQLSLGECVRGVQRSEFFSLPSKSAIYVHTFELRAFTTIFRSVGPVISTLRSTRPGAGGAPRHVSSSRIAFVSGRKSGKTPLSSSCCRMTRRSRRFLRVELKARWRRARNAVASWVRIFFWDSSTEPRMATPWLRSSMEAMVTLVDLVMIWL